MTTKNQKWGCIKGCGACCRLAPAERTEAIQALSPSQQDVYFGLVNSEGWCRHYDTSRQICKIYENRPEFCKFERLAKQFCLTEDIKDTFGIECCRQHIKSIYGGKSPILKRFNRNLLIN